MKYFQKTPPLSYIKVEIIATILISALCWYISNGLNGDFWYLLWVAPIPVLLISFKTNYKTTFIVSFFAYLIGRLSWLSYLVSIITVVPTIILIVLLSIFFAIVIIVTKKIYIKTNPKYAIFIFPIFFTTFEWVLIKFSPDGTAASIAYSQSDLLALVQIASVTGILGITFIVTFIPSVLALSWHHYKETNKLLSTTIPSFIFIVLVFLFGIVRISSSPEKNSTTVGLVVLNENTHSINSVDFQNEIQHIKNYAQEITELAKQGARLVVLPERAININEDIDTISINILSETAKQHHITIVTGYTNFKKGRVRNASLVIDTSGKIVLDYDKVHLVKVLEDRFTSGSEIGLFKFNDLQAGTAICKDLDFPEYVRKYGTNKAIFLCIPAWDFVKDDWLHSRMAILRGVENGFSEIRTARQGRLTISDYYGKVNAEANSSMGQKNTLIGQVSLIRINTIYAQYGDWFGITIIITAILFVLLSNLPRKK